MSRKQTINTKDERFGAVLNCAVRYSMGRKTYMPSLVVDFIIPLLPHLSNQTLLCMERDISDNLESLDWFSQLPIWMGLRDKVDEELKRRAENA